MDNVDKSACSEMASEMAEYAERRKREDLVLVKLGRLSMVFFKPAANEAAHAVR